MIPLSQNLLKKQVAPSGSPSIRVMIQEYSHPLKSDDIAVRGLFDWTRLNKTTQTPSTKNHASCLASDGSLCRLKLVSAGHGTYNIYYQRIENPDFDSDYSQWTLLDTFGTRNNPAFPAADLVACPVSNEVLLFVSQERGYRRSADYGATFGDWVRVYPLANLRLGIKACYKPDSEDLILIYIAGTTSEMTANKCGPGLSGFGFAPRMNLRKRISGVWSDEYHHALPPCILPELKLDICVGMFYDEELLQWDIVFTEDLSFQGFATSTWETSTFALTFNEGTNEFDEPGHQNVYGAPLALSEATEYVQETLKLQPLDYTYRVGSPLGQFYRGLTRTIKEMTVKPHTAYTVPGGMSLIKIPDFPPIMSLWHSEKMYFYVMKRGTTFDECIWTEAYTLDTVAETGLSLLQDDSYIWAIADDQVFRSPLPAYWSPPTEGLGEGGTLELDPDNILRIEENVSEHKGGDLEIILDNSNREYDDYGTGDIEILNRGSRVNLYLGFDSIYSAYAQYFIDELGFGHDINRATFRVHAIDAWKLLERYTFNRTAKWELMPVAKILDTDGVGTTTDLTPINIHFPDITMTNWEIVRVAKKPSYFNKVYNDTINAYKYDTYSLSNAVRAGMIDRVIVKAICSNRGRDMDTGSAVWDSNVGGFVDGGSLGGLDGFVDLGDIGDLGGLGLV